MTASVAIPARLKSSRFPGKVLADIHGQPMLWYVYQGVSQAQCVSAVCVLTDSQEVLETASSWGAKAQMTSEDCPSGTDRIASVADVLDADIVFNVQADEPLITGAVIDQLVGALQGSRSSECVFQTPSRHRLPDRFGAAFLPKSRIWCRINAQTDHAPRSKYSSRSEHLGAAITRRCKNSTWSEALWPEHHPQ